ncbi:MAG: hypothetical protein SH850_00280 [Planctomycetaceae bacterium]|nr:hypothetical protein [Planctomycetaceae bacterium]
MLRWLFTSSEYKRQLRVSAQMQAEQQARAIETDREQKDAIAEHKRQRKEAERQRVEADRLQGEYAAYLERVKVNQERHAKVIDKWEEQAARLDAILTKWEKTP